MENNILMWKLGEHRLLCGDSRKIDDIEKIMDNRKIALCVTSPPYNQGMDDRKKDINKYGGMYKSNKTFLLKMSNAYDDNLPEEKYQKEQIQVLNNIYCILKNNGSLFYNHKYRYRNKQAISPLLWILKTKLNLRQEIIWDRGITMTQNAKMFLPVDERIYWLTKTNKFYFNDNVKKYGTVWPISPVNTIKNKSLPFPNKIPWRCMIACTKKNDIVFDPYAGTGTVLVVAEQLKRKFVGIEIDKSMCEFIVKHWEKFTKKRAHIIKN